MKRLIFLLVISTIAFGACSKNNDPGSNGNNVELKSVRVQTKALALIVKDQKKVTARIAPEDATNVQLKWTTNDGNVATVSVDGTIVAVGAGTTYIKVGDKNIYDSCRVIVADPDVAKFRAQGFVDYKSFGAKGDGKEDDIDAIASAHAFANKIDLPIKANDGATFYISGKSLVVNVRTNTDFGTASFIIDDRDVEELGNPVFLVASDKTTQTLTGISTLQKNQAKITGTFTEPQIITVVNSNVKHYIRLGANQNSGSSQTDVFIVDKTGNVDPNTPIIWDFAQVTSITAIPIDEQLLTIKGGKFQTIANADNKTLRYYSRGINIKRSNVLVDDIKHTITGEGGVGSPYRGFIAIDQCANITVQNSTFTGHKVYNAIGSAGTSVAMGTYDLHANNALNISIINCTQFNDINSSVYWGIFASNFCKNLFFDRCVFSRFDAHQGVTNAVISNSTLGYQGINAIGVGTLLVENTTVYASRFINLRSDYGSTWNGEFIIRNCEFVPRGTNLSSVSLIGGENFGQHNFGYTCYMPERITIENLQIRDVNVSETYAGPTIFAEFNKNMTSASYVEQFPYIKTKEVILQNVKISSGKQIKTSVNSYMFKDVAVTVR